MPLFNLFKSASSGVSIGLDIGSYSVKAAQIKEKRFVKKPFLSFGIREIKPEKSHDSIVAAIKEACSEAKIDSNKVNLSVYGPEIIMRYITLPSLESFDLSRCLEFELERYIPGKKKSNMVIDYKILYRLPNNQMVVLLIGLERQVIEERIAIIKDAGLTPNSINVDSLVLMDAFRAIPFIDKDKEVTAILDIGYSVSKLVVFQEDIPYFSRDITNSGVYNFLQLICQNMNLDFEHARDLILNPQDKTQEVYEAIKINISILMDELRLSFEYCGRNLQKKVSRLYLSGGGSKLKMLDENLSSGLNLKTSLLDVTGGFAVSSALTQEELRQCAPFLTVAVGMAMQ